MISKQKLLKLRILTPSLQNLLVVLSEGLPFSKKKRKRKEKTYCISIRLVLRSSFSLLISMFSVRLPTSSNCLKCEQDKITRLLKTTVDFLYSVAWREMSVEVVER